MFIRRCASVILGLLVTLSIVLSACGEATPKTPASSASVPTPAQPRQLTICLGQEPESLYPLGNPSSVARSILSAVYDGPIDSTSYGYQPVILTKLPSLADGDATLSAISVYVGDEVIDADGTPVTLAPGMRVRPAGCRSDDCAVEYDGKSEVRMDQVVATFSLLPGLKWSDGSLLTADDSVFSFMLSANPKTPGSKFLIDRTKSYEAVDGLTVQWWGKPGYIDPTYFLNFWTPYPKHLWESFPVEELLETEVTALSPVGWGPYVIQEWEKGDHITLTRNPYYFRAGEGLPKFTTLTFRFTPDPQAAISDLLAGKCDILDPSVPLDGQVSLLRPMDEQGQLRALIVTTPVMERLDLGIRPVSYDNGYAPGIDRSDFFGDVRLRQALAMCIDRQKVVNTVSYGLTSVPDSYIPAEHPLYNSAVTKYPYNVAAANQLLEQAGWRDVDNDPSTPRHARGVTGVSDGTPLELNYFTTGAAQRVQVATIVAESLAQCGIKVNIQYLDQTALYAAGPEGPLFGRNFDLAELAMGSTGSEPPCAWFTSSEVPTAANHWVGTNVSGYNNSAFDAACLSARQSLPDESSYPTSYDDTQMIFTQDLPTIPLYWRLKVAAARPDLCNFSLDPTTSSNLWNIERLDYGSACNQ